MAKRLDRIKQVETTKERYGEDYYREIGRKGAEKSKATRFNSEKGKAAVEARWKKYREKQKGAQDE